LLEQIGKMDEATAAAPFDMAADPKKCGVRWEYDRCLRDLLTHLYEWQVLMRMLNERNAAAESELKDARRLVMARIRQEQEEFSKRGGSK
jgi:hypothetical protein